MKNKTLSSTRLWHRPYAAGLLVLSLFLLMATGLRADDHRVSLRQAQAEATAFMQAQGIRFRPVTPRRAQRASADTVYAPYYIVSGRQGFAVVSGDSRAEPILGYATRGTIDPDQLPCNVRAWLDTYQQAIAALDGAASPALASAAISTSSSLASPSSSRSPVGKQPFYFSSPSEERALGRRSGGGAAPLLTTQWSQTAPFNDQAPLYNGVHCVAGCVATAMAQLIAYHRYPSSVKSIPAYTANAQVGNLAALPATTIDWTAISAGSGTAYQAEAAKLTRYCGQAVQMDYGVASSGAYSENAATALINYFGYDAGLCIARRQWYTIAGWDSLLIAELSAGRPLYYTASSKTESHAFIIDGYDGNGLYHVNWGWGGYCDGYFRISVLAPHDPSGLASSPSSDGFATRQWALTLVAPTPVAVTTPSVTCTALAVNGNKVTMTLMNRRRTAVTVVPALAEIDYRGDTIIYGPAASVELPGVDVSGYNRAVTTEAIDLSHQMRGKTVLRPAYRIGDDWRLCESAGYYLYVVENNDGSLSITRHPLTSLSATLSTKGTPTLGSTATVEATVTNSGDEYSGMLYGFIGPTGQTLQNMLSTTVNIAAGGTERVLLNCYPPEAGTYQAVLSTDASHNTVIGQTTFTVTSTQTQPEALQLGQTGVSVASGYAAVTFQLVNQGTELYGRPLHIVLHNRETGATTRTYDITGISIQPGASRQWTISFTGLPNDGVYTFDIYAYTYASGADQTIVGSVEVNMPQANTARNKLTLTASRGGYIAYLSSTVTDGTQTFDVQQGSDVRLTVRANHGYKLSAVTLDGQEVTAQLSADGTYVLKNILVDHTVEAEFAAKQSFTVTATASAGGTLTVGNAVAGSQTVSGSTATLTVTEDDALSLTLRPDAGYELRQLLVGDEDVTTHVFDGSYTIDPVTRPLDIQAVFAKIEMATVVIRQNNRGIVSLSLVKGRRCRFRVSPDATGTTATVTVGGQTLTPVAGTTDTYEFTPTADGTLLTVTFQQ